MKKQAGFTLIELVVVIVVLGILAAVALPKYEDLAQTARDAVMDGAIGAFKSAAVIQFAKNNGVAQAFNDIRDATNAENVTFTGTCAAGVATHSGGGTKNFSVSAEICS